MEEKKLFTCRNPYRSGVSLTVNQSSTFSIPRSRPSGEDSGICRYKTTDPRQRRSGVRNRLGFTLIELLVVVLIIGILAAVAVPQYQKAVWKSRNAQLKTLAQSVAQAEQAYYLANGEYSFNFDTLDLDLPLSAPVQNGSKEGKCGFAIGGTDAVRRGKNFEIVLGGLASNPSYVSVQAVWLDDPYKCTGFAWFSDSQKMACREKHSSNDGTVGNFCQKLEKGTFTSNNSLWYYYDLP